MSDYKPKTPLESAAHYLNLAGQEGDSVQKTKYLELAGDNYLKAASVDEGDKIRLIKKARGAYGAALDEVEGYENFRIGFQKKEKEVPSQEKIKSELEKRLGSVEAVLKNAGLRSSASDPKLSHAFAATSVLFLFGALFFISLNLTGAAIGSVPSIGNHWIGLGLFAVGIAFAMLYFRRKVSK